MNAVTAATLLASTVTRGIMIDIETLGTKHDAVVTQFGMVPWRMDDPTADAGAHLHSVIPIAPQQTLLPPRVIDASTVLYWLKQGDEARDVFKDNDSDDYQELFAYCQHFITRFETLTRGENYEVWTRGQFDLPILESLFRQVGLKAPWADNFRAIRDLRTLMATAGVSVKDVPEPEGFVKHNALWDCRFQIDCYVESMRQLRAR